MSCEVQIIQRAHRFALDPTPRQARMLASHAGGARFAYNWGLARIIAALDAREAEKGAGGEATTALPAHFDLCAAWTAWKNEHAADPEPPEGERRTNTAWVAENSVGTYQAALRDAAKAWTDFFESRSGKRKGRKLGRPRFKKKGKSRDSFQVHGESLRMAGAKKIVLPKIGTVTIMSDDSLHPAMSRSRSRAGGPRAVARAERRYDRTTLRLAAAVKRYEHAIVRFEHGERRTRMQGPEHLATEVRRARDAVHAAQLAMQDARAAEPSHSRHMGNRRRSDHLWRHMRHSGEQAGGLAVLLRRARHDAGLSVVQAVAALNDEADARAMARARALLVTAEAALAGAGDDDDRKKARARITYAQGKLRKLEQAEPGQKAPRTERWTDTRLAALEKTGVTAGPEQASVICAAWKLDGDTREQVTDLAAQAGITRATITLGADGLWWCSVGAEIPHTVRVGADPKTGEKVAVPSRRQRKGGLIGVDFGVREIATISDGSRIPNPRYLRDALAELRAAQKHLSRCQPGSKRREKAKRRVGIIHADIARQRDAELHRATTALVRHHDVIAMEGWDVQQVMRDGSKDLPRRLRRNRNRALADTGVGMGRQMITYKSPAAGVTAMITSPQAKTGRTCSVDGKARTTPLPPGQEIFTSDQCGHTLDRRVNTARALAGWARQEISEHGPAATGPAQPRGGSIRPGTVRRDGQPPVKRAASPRPRPG